MKNIDAVYIHIPFCKKICTYCDFCKFYYNDTWANNYLEALLREVKDRYMDEELRTVYIGGGTPSALSPAQLNKLFAITNLFKLAKEYEFTFECNLDDLNENLLNTLLENKVNRLSIGIQSFDERKLKFLGRKASFEEAKEKIALCKAKGITNINVDLIYALPGENLGILKRDLQKLKKLKVPHISTYSLIIEKNTILAYKKARSIPQELDEKMYKKICHFLGRLGYNHYEISNFAKKGYEAKHNLNYWNNEEYYGFGLGASGFTFKVRYDNTKSLTEYLKGNYKLNEEILSDKDMMDYELMLGLRKLEGINLKEFYDKYHVNLQNKYNIDKLIKENDLIFEDGNIFINPDKLYIMNEILLKLV